MQTFGEYGFYAGSLKRAVDGNNFVDIGEDDLDNPQSPLGQELALLYGQRKNITIIFGKFIKQ